MPCNTRRTSQEREKSRLSAPLLIALALLVVAVGVAVFLGYNVWYLNSSYLNLQAQFVIVVEENQRQAERIRQQSAEISQTSQDNQHLEARFLTERAERNRDVATLQGNVDSLATQIEDERAAHGAEIQGINGRLTETRRQLADSEQQVFFFEAANAVLEDSVASLDGQVTQLTNTNYELFSERNNLAHQVTQLETSNQRLTRSNSVLERRLERLTTQNDNLTRENNSLTLRVATLEANLTDAQRRQLTIPTCASNLFTLDGGRLSCAFGQTGSSQSRDLITDDGARLRKVTLPHSGTVTLIADRKDKVASERSMDIMEHAAKTIEGYMGEHFALESKIIRMDFVDGFGGWSNVLGRYRGTYFEVLAELDDRDVDRRADDQLALTIAHELAHYYWNDNRTWLDEGAAEFLAVYSENQRIGRPMERTNSTCFWAFSIRYLERRKYEQGSRGFYCNYSLGESLFLGLYDVMPPDRFQRSFRDLLEISTVKKGGVYQVRQAFPNTPTVQEVVDKWYGYREPPERHWSDGSFLAYFTWKQGGRWVHRTEANNVCAIRVHYVAEVRKYRSFGHGRCQYHGEWGENGDLMVELGGEEYRAVELRLSGYPYSWEEDTGGGEGIHPHPHPGPHPHPHPDLTPVPDWPKIPANYDAHPANGRTLWAGPATIRMD